MQIVPTSTPVIEREVDVIDNRIAELVESVRAYRERIAVLEAKNDSAKEALRQLLAARGENWSDDEGYARLVPESTRVSYESKALDDLIIREPLHYGWLKDYRKQSTIQSSVQVK